MPQREIGSELGVSQMQISRISRRALGKLLTAVRGEQADGSAKSGLSGLGGCDPAARHPAKRAESSEREPSWSNTCLERP